jgi:hypothetical protein
MCSRTLSWICHIGFMLKILPIYHSANMRSFLVSLFKFVWTPRLSRILFQENWDELYKILEYLCFGSCVGSWSFLLSAYVLPVVLRCLNCVGQWLTGGTGL